MPERKGSKDGEWKLTGRNPDTGKPYFSRVKIGKPKVVSQPEPPLNFTPEELAKTFPESNPPILSGAQGYAQAREAKEE